MSLISARGRRRQAEIFEFKARLGYRVSSITTTKRIKVKFNKNNLSVVKKYLVNSIKILRTSCMCWALSDSWRRDLSSVF